MTSSERPPRGLRLGRVAGVPVLLQPSWFVLAALVVAVYGDVLGEQVDNGYGAATAFVVLLLVSVVLHEIGHCVVARAFDLPVRSISVSFLAGITEITEPPQTAGREYAVAVSGPMVSLLLGGVSAAGALLATSGSTAELVLQLVAAANVVVALFNLLPGLPLDGGRVLRSVVWRVTGDEQRGTVVSARCGQVVGIVALPLVVFVVVPLTGGEVTLTTAVLVGVVGGFVYLGATAALTAARAEQRLPSVNADALARPALPVPAGLPLAEALRRAHAQGVHAIVVVDGEGTARGIVSEQRVLAVPEERRPWVDVATTARRVEQALVLEAGLSGEALVAALRATPATEYLVRDAAGGPPRVLVAADVARALAPLPSH